MLPGIYPTFQRWAEQTVWIYADPHFNDKELAQGICGRPSDAEQVAMINSCVGRKDTLIVLGDVGDPSWMKQVRGRKILICGNHDTGASNYTDIFDEIYTGALIIGEKIILSHEPIQGITWALNIHGHVHDRRHVNDQYHFNVCADVIGYKPMNFNQFLKAGPTARIQSIHRTTIDNATKRKQKRGGTR